MGDVGVIARRLRGKRVQYGWGGNGAALDTTGISLLKWYNDPEMVEYLFGLGQLRSLWYPHSEVEGSLYKTIPTGDPHWLGVSELEIFSKIVFIDVGFFYDLDKKWYYVKPGPFRIKIPLELMVNCVDGRRSSHEVGKFIDGVEEQLCQKIRDLYDESEDFRSYLEASGYNRKKFMESMDAVIRMEGADYWLRRPNLLWDHHRKIFDYFDDWVVVVPNEDNTAVQDILMRKKEEKHMETIYWDGKYQPGQDGSDPGVTEPSWAETMAEWYKEGYERGKREGYVGSGLEEYAEGYALGYAERGWSDICKITHFLTVRGCSVEKIAEVSRTSPSVIRVILGTEPSP